MNFRYDLYYLGMLNYLLKGKEYVELPDGNYIRMDVSFHYDDDLRQMINPLSIFTFYCDSLEFVMGIGSKEDLEKNFDTEYIWRFLKNVDEYKDDAEEEYEDPVYNTPGWEKTYKKYINNLPYKEKLKFITKSEGLRRLSRKPKGTQPFITDNYFNVWQAQHTDLIYLHTGIIDYLSYKDPDEEIQKTVSDELHKLLNELFVVKEELPPKEERKDKELILFYTEKK